jgi:hypothetical protein
LFVPSRFVIEIASGLAKKLSVVMPPPFLAAWLFRSYVICGNAAQGAAKGFPHGEHDGGT